MMWDMRVILWGSGMLAFWSGVLLAQINGYPLRLPHSLVLAVVLAVGQVASLWRLTWGREVVGSLALGLLPLTVGFYLQSGHWVSEGWILGFLLSLAAVNALLAYRWHHQWQEVGQEATFSRPRPHGLALVFTLLNIMVIAGLLLIWYFPANPLPGRDGAWGLAVFAVVNQEFIKRQYYLQPQASTRLAWSAALFSLTLSLWVLAICTWRLQD